MVLPFLASNTVKTMYEVPSQCALMEPSSSRFASVTRLQVGKLYLMMRDATAAASPFGAAPVGGRAFAVLEIAHRTQPSAETLNFMAIRYCPDLSSFTSSARPRRDGSTYHGDGH